MLKVTLLGTGGTQPLPDRALAAAAVTVGGRSVLLDCGEGTQVGLRRYGVSAYRLSAVLLTHYHGDHILGLPGLLQTMGSLNRTEPLTIYGEEMGYLSDNAPKSENVNIFEAEIAHFIDCLRTGKRPASDLDQAVTMQRMLQGIYDSARLHKEVEI